MTKDLGTAAAKLQGALKKMQTALMEEKQVSAKLKAQIGTKEEVGLTQKIFGHRISYFVIVICGAIKISESFVRDINLTI